MQSLQLFKQKCFFRGNRDSCISENECLVCNQQNHVLICPKAAMNPYIWFYLDVYKELAPKDIGEIGEEAGRRWREMSF